MFVAGINIKDCLGWIWSLGEQTAACIAAAMVSLLDADTTARVPLEFYLRFCRCVVSYLNFCPLISRHPPAPCCLFHQGCGSSKTAGVAPSLDFASATTAANTQNDVASSPHPSGTGLHRRKGAKGNSARAISAAAAAATAAANVNRPSTDSSDGCDDDDANDDGPPPLVDSNAPRQYATAGGPITPPRGRGALPTSPPQASPGPALPLALAPPSPPPTLREKAATSAEGKRSSTGSVLERGGSGTTKATLNYPKHVKSAAKKVKRALQDYFREKLTGVRVQTLHGGNITMEYNTVSAELFRIEKLVYEMDQPALSCFCLGVVIVCLYIHI